MLSVLARHELQKLGCVCNHAIVSPVSNRYGKEGLLSNENRYEMLNLTFRNDEWVRVSDWELIQPDWVRTVDVFLHYSVSCFPIIVVIIILIYPIVFATGIPVRLSFAH